MKYVITFVLVFLTLGLMGSLTFISYHHELTQNSLMKGIEEEIEETSNIKIEQINHFLEEQNQIFDEIFDEELFLQLLKLPEESREYEVVFEKVMEKLKYSRAVSAGVAKTIGDERVIIASKNPLFVGIDISKSPMGKRSEDGRFYAIYPGGGPSELFLASTVLIEENGIVLGSYGIQIPLDELHEIVKVPYDIGIEGEAYLINENFLLLTPSKFLHGENKGVLTQVVNTENTKNCFDKDFIGHNSQEEAVIVHKFLDYRGEEVFGTHRETSGAEWCLIVEIDEKNSIHFPLKQNAIRNMYLSLVGMVILFFLGFFLGMRFEKAVLEGKFKTWPYGVIKIRKFLTNLKLRYFFLFATLFAVGYFFLVTSFFQGWQNAKLFDDIPDLLIFIVGFMIFAYGLKIKKTKARNFIILGGLLISLQKLIEIPLQEYQAVAGILNTIYWIPTLTIAILGFLFLLIGFKEALK